MEKRNRSFVYGMAGACAGAVSLASAAGPCRGGDCSACLHCVGMGLALASLALARRLRKGKIDGLSRSGE